MNELEELLPGDYKNIDEYIQELKKAGYQASYENIWSGPNGFTAVVSVEGEKHAIFEGTPTGHLVKEIRRPLSQIG